MSIRLIVAVLFLGWIQSHLLTREVYSQEGTKWTNPDGKVVAGEFVRMDGKAVVLKLDTGKEVKVPLSSLSLESHLQALKLAKPEAFSKELIKAPIVVEAAAPSVVAPITSIMESPFGQDPNIDQFLKTAVSEWKRGNNFVVWHMLPPRMQNDLIQIIANTMKDVGPGGTTIFRSAFEVLGSLFSKKRDWIQETELVKLFPVPGGPDQLDKNWPIMVGMMQKMAEPGLWDPANFEPNSVVPWLAQMSELLAYSREISPELNEISYQVVSQSSDRAEVEVSLGSTPPMAFNFQKVGDIWVVPEIMVSLRENVDKELAEAPTLKALKTVMAALGIMTPTLKAMDLAKTREDFDKAYKQSGLAGMLSSIPAAPSGQAGGSMLPGLPSGLPGLPMGIPGLPGSPSGPPGP